MVLSRKILGIERERREAGQEAGKKRSKIIKKLFLFLILTKERCGGRETRR
jgi:hypothetical protein